MKTKLRLKVYVNGKRTPVMTKEVVVSRDIPISHKIAEILLQSTIEYNTERVLVKIETIERSV